jgi:hypothetical protein
MHFSFLNILKPLLGMAILDVEVSFLILHTQAKVVETHKVVYV